MLKATFMKITKMLVKTMKFYEKSDITRLKSYRQVYSAENRSRIANGVPCQENGYCTFDVRINFEEYV